MKDKIYLLDLEEFALSGGKALFAEALEKIDSVRLERAQRIKAEAAKQKCVGAGLILQKAVADWFAEASRETTDAEKVQFADAEQNSADGIYRLSVSTLLQELGIPRELPCCYGQNGKPYLTEFPLYFNLSHSGDFVLCAVSDREIGADIQEIRESREMKTANRFFVKEELAALKACASREERTALFYRLWTRKEAYGKLTGQGIAESISRNLLDRQDVTWLEFAPPKGYEACVCRKVI